MSQTHPQRQARAPRPRWEVPALYGYAGAIQGFGSVAAPLLAGFSLTLLVLVIQAPAQLRWPEWTLVLLALATVGFICTVQFAGWARAAHTTPADILQWWPDVWDDAGQAERLRREQRSHFETHEAWAKRVAVAFNLSIIFLFAAIALALIPPKVIGLIAARSIAFGVVVAALVFEILWFGALIWWSRRDLSQQPGWLGRFVLRFLEPARRPRNDE